MSEPREGPGVPDELFARVAVGRRFVELRALGECLDTMRRAGGAERRTLSATMLRRGVITREDVETILGIARAGELELRYVEDFAIITKIGEGGMGSVYAAMDVESCELCAVKVLPADLAEDEDLVRRFKREAEVAVGLDHRNIVCGIRTGEVEGLHYFAMEFVDGETVYERLEREGPIPEGDTLRILRGACVGLAYASEHGLVHRDIKPENVIVAHDGTPKLLDLGLVKKADASRVSRLTQDGMAIGTPHYISPEQARGEHDVDTRSDIYALGATAYHMLTGAVPFEGPTAAVIMTKHLSEELDWPSDVNPEISEHASRLVSRMMAKEPHDRYQRPKDIVADIDLILSGKAPSGEMLPPGASSIRGAVRISRAIRKAERKQRERAERGTTAVYERIEKRRGVPLLKVFERHRKVMIPAAGILFALAAIVFVIALVGEEGPEGGLPDFPSAPAATVPTGARAGRPSPARGAVLAERLEELMNAPPQRIWALIDALSDLGDLTPEEARLVVAAKRAARERFDAEAERRFRDILSREKEGLIDRARALEELQSLQETFARSSLVPRIMAAVADHTGPVRPLPPEIRGVRLVDARGFEGWKSYGDWGLLRTSASSVEPGGRDGVDEIVFRYDPENPYSRALVCPLGFGECSVSMEVYTEGGERGQVSLWEQGAEDKLEGAADSAVRIALGEADVKLAERRWARLEIAAGAGGVQAFLEGRPLSVERDGDLSHGRLTFSFVGGVWRVRKLEVLPALADGEVGSTTLSPPRGEVVYEVGFGKGETHGWAGSHREHQSTNQPMNGVDSLIRSLSSVPPPPGGQALRFTRLRRAGRPAGPREGSLAAERVEGEWGAWAYVGARGERGDVRTWKTLFELAGRERLAFAFRAERAPELKARIVVETDLTKADRAGGTPYEFRLSGRPPQKQWTALTVPLADFRSEAGRPPPVGGRVTGLWIGAPAAQPELLISLVRVVR